MQFVDPGKSNAMDTSIVCTVIPRWTFGVWKQRKMTGEWRCKAYRCHGRLHLLNLPHCCVWKCALLLPHQMEHIKYPALKLMSANHDEAMQVHHLTTRQSEDFLTKPGLESPLMDGKLTPIVIRKRICECRDSHSTSLGLPYEHKQEAGVL